jgi:hypothetical protein
MMGASSVNIAKAERPMGNAAGRRCPTIAETNVPRPRTEQGKLEWTPPGDGDMTVTHR